MGDGEAGRPAGALRYEELLAQAGPGAVRIPRARRAPGGGAVLHERHDRQPQGVLYSHRSISMHSTGTLMRDGARARARRPGAGGGADVPRQRLGAALRCRAGGRRPGAARPLPGRRAAGGADRVRERPTLMACVPTIFSALLRYADEHPELDLRSLTTPPAAARRCRVADEGLRGAPRRAAAARLGDDRDEPVAHVARPAGRARGGVATARHAGPAGAVGGAAARRRRRRARCRGTAQRRARSRSAVLGWPPATSAKAQRREVRRRMAAHRRHRAVDPGGWVRSPIAPRT